MRRRACASSSHTHSSARCPTGTFTPGIGLAKGHAAFASTACAARALLRETFEPRPGFEPNRLADARVARVWFSPEGARFRVERGAQELTDGAALEELHVGSPEWLVSEILSLRGEAVVLDPPDLRTRVGKRARQLLRELGPKKPRARARR